jgi:hypothetical protein
MAFFSFGTLWRNSHRLLCGVTGTEVFRFGDKELLLGELRFFGEACHSQQRSAIIMTKMYDYAAPLIQHLTVQDYDDAHTR